MTKRIIALFLALILTVGLLPTVALAADGDAGTTPSAAATTLKPEDEYYTFNGEHVGEAEDADITLSKTAVENEDGTYTVTLTATAKEKVTPVKTKVVFVLDASGSMNYCTQSGATEENHSKDRGDCGGGSWSECKWKNNNHLHTWDDSGRAVCTLVEGTYKPQGQTAPKSRWEIATSAISNMVKNLPDGVETSFVYFGGYKKEGKWETFADTATAASYPGVTPNGGTPLTAGLNKGIEQFNNSNATNRVIILVADGETSDKSYPTNTANNFKKNGTIYTVGFTFSSDGFNNLSSGKTQNEKKNYQFLANNADQLEVALTTIREKIIGMISDPMGDKVTLDKNSVAVDKTASTANTTKTDTKIEWTDTAGLDGKVTLTYNVSLKPEMTSSTGVKVIALNGNATFNYSYKQGNTTISKSLSFPKPQATVYVAALQVKYVDEANNPITVPGAYSEVKRLPATFATTIPTVGSTVTVGGTTYYVKSVTGDTDKANKQLTETEANATEHTITVVLTETPPTATYKVEHYKQNLDGTYPTTATETDDNLTGNTGATATAEAKTYTGFTFDENNENNVKTGIIAANGSLVLNLYYTRNKHSITYTYTDTAPEGAPAVPTAENGVPFGTSKDVADVPILAGYTFDGWKTDDVTVTDNKFTMPDSDVTFTGSWTKNTANVDLNGYIKKCLKVEEGSTLPENYAETFNFIVSIDGNEQSFVLGSVTMNTEGTSNVTFSGTIPLTVGSHTFTVRETAPMNGTSGMTYDTAEKTFALNVTENGCTFGHMNDNGEFVPAGDEDAKCVTITNTYTQPKNSINLGELIKKNFSLTAGSESLPEDASYIFDVRVYEKFAETVSDAPYFGTVKMSDVGTAYFDFSKTKDKGELTFTEPGTHEYIVEEIKGDAANVEYDPHRYILKLEVDDNLTITASFGGYADNEAATLSVENAPELDPTTDTSVVTIKNTYYKKPAPGTIDFSDIISKHLTKKGDKAFTGAEFTANVTGWKYDEAPQGEPQALALFTNEGPEFTFTSMSSLTLTATFPADTTVFDSDNVAYGSFAGTLTVEEGQYLFLVEENNDGKSNITYDENKYWIKVYVDISEGKTYLGIFVKDYVEGDSKETVLLARDWTEISPYITPVIFSNTIDTGKDDYIPIIIPTIVGKDTGMLNKTDHFAYVIGYPDGTVHPNGQITRAEVATIFFRLLKDEVRDGAFTTSNSYSDVAYGKWYNNPISTMSALGIITGYPDGTFKPDKPITRAEFAAIAARFDETQYGKSATFSDVIGHWAANEIGIAYANEWIKGYPDGTFKPDQNITRAEAMTMINRVLERKPESPSDLLTDMNKWTDNMDTSKWYYLDVQEATNSHAYTRKTFNYELWRQMLTDPDWSRYER